MTEHQSLQPEHARRNLVLASAVTAFFIAAASPVPSWLSATPPHRWIDLVMQAVPPLSAAALFAGLCIGFVSLCPLPRLTAATAITFPAMHVSITYAMAQLLSSRSNALMQPLPEQVPIQSWLMSSTWLTAFVAELVVFSVAAFVQARTNRRNP
jgi:hypothetical protein